MKLIASANAERHVYAPEVRTLREQGLDIAVDPYCCVAAPAGLPAEARAALVAALAAAVASDKVQDVARNALAAEPRNLGPDATKAMVGDGRGSIRDLFGN